MVPGLRGAGEQREQWLQVLLHGLQDHLEPQQSAVLPHQLHAFRLLLNPNNRRGQTVSKGTPWSPQAVRRKGPDPAGDPQERPRSEPGHPSPRHSSADTAGASAPGLAQGFKAELVPGLAGEPDLGSGSAGQWSLPCPWARVSPGQCSGPCPHCRPQPGPAPGTAGHWPAGGRSQQGSRPPEPPCRSLRRQRRVATRGLAGRPSG